MNISTILCYALRLISILSLWLSGIFKLDMQYNLLILIVAVMGIFPLISDLFSRYLGWLIYDALKLIYIQAFSNLLTKDLVYMKRRNVVKNLVIIAVLEMVIRVGVISYLWSL